MIKIIALDLDGTLLTDSKDITDETLKELERAKQKGVRIVIDTGRNFSGAMASIGRYNLGCDYIVSSGAEIRNSDGELLQSIEMNKDEFRQIYDIARDAGLAVRFCSEENDYIVGTPNEVSEALRKEAELFYTPDFEAFSQTELFKTYREHTLPVESLDKLLKLNIPIYKIFMCSDDITLLKKIEDEISCMGDVVSASSFPTNIELTHIDAQKGIALEKYARDHGCTNDEVMAFGDSMNDYSMLAMNFGYTVAMENAAEEIKAVSKYVTLSNEENGVAHMIRKFV